MSEEPKIVSELGEVSYSSGQFYQFHNVLAELRQEGYVPYPPNVQLHCPLCGKPYTYLQPPPATNAALAERVVIGCEECGLVFGRGVLSCKSNLPPADLQIAAVAEQNDLAQGLVSLTRDALDPAILPVVQSYRKHFGFPPLPGPDKARAAAPEIGGGDWQPLEAPLEDPVPAIRAAGLKPYEPEPLLLCPSCHQPFQAFRRPLLPARGIFPVEEEQAVACSDCGLATSKLMEIFSPRDNQHYAFERLYQERRELGYKHPATLPAYNVTLQAGLDWLAHWVQRPDLRDWIARYRAAHGLPALMQ